MITQLYTFSPSSYVAAEEWNSNFKALQSVNSVHSESLSDAYDELAFPSSDDTQIISRAKAFQNSWGVNDPTIVVAPGQEYYKVLSNGQNLVINIPNNLNSEARILIQTQESSSLFPFTVNYDGTKVISYGHYNYDYFRAGFYYIMIYETNGLAQIKLLWAVPNS